jgi:5-formyltetrahydrofolate cyclo-ligase
VSGDATALARWRREQREQLLAARLAMSTEAHRTASCAIAERLSRHLQEHRPATLAGYWPIRREFNPLPLMQQLLASGVRIALPATPSKQASLEFRLWYPGTALGVGAYGIPYPSHGAPVLPDTLLIPLLGYDVQGYRLGYGGGFYDRTVAALARRPHLVGLGFAAARLPSIRPQPHDARMDWIITEDASLDYAAPKPPQSV